MLVHPTKQTALGLVERLLARVSKQAEERGDSFVLSDFFDEMNRAGCIPMTLIEWQMTGEYDDPTGS